MVNKKSSSSKSKFSKKDLTRIREDLVKQKARILEELVKIRDENLGKGQKDYSGDLSGYTLHMADMATDLYDREFSLELAEGERERLFALDDALKRIDEGIYGKCDSCEGAISRQRLKAMPQAQKCIKCQEEEEKNETGR
jgi:DnaK suppressor protein